MLDSTSTVYAAFNNLKRKIFQKPIKFFIVIAFLQYLPSLFFGLTKLDDSTFIIQFQPYNADLSNIFTSFSRGVFNSSKFQFYRPIFLDSIILNSQICGQSIFGYHFVNIAFHAICICLLYTLLKQLNYSTKHSFVLSLVFAVHPVLVQAISWIPGRNDSLLAIFTLLFFIHSIKYTIIGKIKFLIWSIIFLLAALFTKETAVASIPVIIILLISFLNVKWNNEKCVLQYSFWVAAIVFWYNSSLYSSNVLSEFSFKHIISDFIHRLPSVLQYFGKVFLPVNLSVYPIQQNISIIYGLVAVVLLFVITIFAKHKSYKLIFAGLIIFFIFLIPVLLTPNFAQNPQVFEHRLYLPIIGILLILPQTFVFKNKLKPIYLNTLIIAVVIYFSVLNYLYQNNFSSPLAFWTQALKTNPNTANPIIMTASLTTDRNLSNKLFKIALQKFPKQKYLNYRYGVYLYDNYSIIESEKYFLAESKTSCSYECFYYLSKIALLKNDTVSAIKNMQTFLRTDPFFNNSTDSVFFLDPKLTTGNYKSLFISPFFTCHIQKYIFKRCGFNGFRTCKTTFN